MVSQTQQELQRVQSDVQRFQTDLQQVKTTVADRFSQEERTIEGTLSSARVEIQDELSVFKNDVQSQISSLESMIRNFFEQPRVPTGVTTKSLASSTIMVVIPPPMVWISPSERHRLSSQGFDLDRGNGCQDIVQNEISSCSKFWVFPPNFHRIQVERFWVFQSFEGFSWIFYHEGIGQRKWAVTSDYSKETWFRQSLV
ncbi:hypothetical protein V6N11_031369 [Hibiscus sabdariffa]|uniref:Uncharacterized protein n=1 Tax=Hibiscus sabdariffa TaxID=183260 RepID=A0ABR2SXE3_9ROSI